MIWIIKRDRETREVWLIFYETLILSDTIHHLYSYIVAP